MKPNIVLFNCDDLGYGDLGCYGSTRNDTPVLDRLAREGRRFTSFYMASPVCSPSRGAMMTGCYPPRIGFGSFHGNWVLFPGDSIGLNPSEITIAKLLQDAGYATMHVGKWHCGDQPDFLPTRHGFDDYYGLPYSNDMGPSGLRPDLPPLPLLHGETVIEQQPDQCSLTERYVERSLAFIRANRDRPFFLYFAHMHVHLPLYAPAHFVKSSRNGDYGACVSAIDWAAGAVLYTLEMLGLRENTIVIFTSDNGSRNDFGESNGPLRGTKGTTWEGGQRVPFIVNWPGHIAPSVSDGLMASLDLYPTLARLCGAVIPTDRIIDGIDATGLLTGNTEESPRDTFFYYMCNYLEAVRSGNWKLHVSRSVSGTHPSDGQREPVFELYDLSKDIAEENNVYSRNPQVVAALHAKMEDCRKDLGDESMGMPPTNARPVGRVENARPMTQYNPNHPYIIALYDRDEVG